MSLKAMSMTTRRSGKRAAVLVSTRSFQQRPKFECHPEHIGTLKKEKFNYADIQPVRDPEKMSIVQGGLLTRQDNLYHQYSQVDLWQAHSLGKWSGYYGRHWAPNFGYQHHFLKRRLKTVLPYTDKNPIKQAWMRFKDNRGLDWSYPFGQYHHLIFKWLWWTWAVIIFFRMKGKLQAQRSTDRNPDVEEVWVPEYNLAFWQYIVKGLDATPKNY